MTDEYVVVVTTDEYLLSQIQNATNLRVIHHKSYASEIEINHQFVLLILDIDTIDVTREKLLEEHQYNPTIAVMNSHDNNFIELNGDLFSDFWFKPIHTSVLSKRIVRIHWLKQAIESLESLAFGMRYEFTAIEFRLNMIQRSIENETHARMSQWANEILEIAKRQNKTVEYYRFLNELHSSSSYTIEILPRLATDLTGYLKYLQNHLELIDKLEIELPELPIVLQISQFHVQQIVKSILYSHKLSETGSTVVKVWVDSDNLNLLISSKMEFIEIDADEFVIEGSPMSSDAIKKIISAHLGGISVASSPETGSIFHLTIPRAKKTSND